MAMRLTVHLKEPQRAEVDRRYRAAHDAETRTRYQMVLLAADGKSAPQIGWMTRRSEDTVRRVLGRFLHQGLDAVPRRRPPGRAVEVTAEWRAELERVIDLEPRSVGVPSAVWTTRLLSGYLERVTGHHAAIETVRVYLHRLGYVCKRPTWSLKRKASQQAGWVKKRLRVEVLLAAAASPVPPSLDDLVPDPLLRDELPEDLSWLLRLLSRADLYLQDEVEIACTRP